MAPQLTGTTSTSSYTLLIVLRSLWGFQWWKATWDMCATAALVEQVQLCWETYGTSCFPLYMLFINSCLCTVLQRDFLETGTAQFYSSYTYAWPWSGQTCAWFQHDVYVVLLHSPWRWKDTYSSVVSNNEGQYILENRTADYVPASPWL